MVTVHSSKIKLLHGSENQKNSPLIIVSYLFQLNEKKKYKFNFSISTYVMMKTIRVAVLKFHYTEDYSVW